MADRHVVGDTVRIARTFTVDGSPVDPATITLVVTDPSGNVEGTYTYAGGSITKLSTGSYYKDLAVDEAGKWSCKWTSTGTGADVAVRTFTVHAASVEALDLLTYGEGAEALKIGSADTENAARVQSAITAVSRRLDDLCGPIVRRTVTAETHWTAGADHINLRLRPVAAVTTVTEYSSSGTATTLTAETSASKPADGYLAIPRNGLGATLSGRIERRSGGTGACFDQSVAVTYTAGRYTDTATVDPVFKEAAVVCLINWWQQVLSQPPVAGVDLDLPGFRFPSYAVPNAARDLLPASEVPCPVMFG